ncbi:hypothetical protein [Prochlorococcus marinus]|nr:hypothetical protein [Prochlorococcus marinus]
MQRSIRLSLSASPKLPEDTERLGLSTFPKGVINLTAALELDQHSSH